jgi:hypothetical protein
MTISIENIAIENYENEEVSISRSEKQARYSETSRLSRIKPYQIVGAFHTLRPSLHGR